MEKLITPREAILLVAGSMERKAELIKETNSAIIDQAKQGKRYTHLPYEISDAEKQWLKEELKTSGYSIKQEDATVVVKW